MVVLVNIPEVGVGWDLSTGNANVFPGDADAAGPGTHFVNLCSK